MTPETREELKDAIREMEDASNAFYHAATRIGNHPFIEFTGFLNEYIKLCADALTNDIDFRECNNHSGKELPTKQYHVDYVREKLECIFGDAIVDKMKLGEKRK